MDNKVLDSNTWYQEFIPFVDGVWVRWDDLQLNIPVGKNCKLELYYEYSWLIGNPDALVELEYLGSIKGLVFDPPINQGCAMAAGTTSLIWTISTELADIGPFLLHFSLRKMGLPESPPVPGGVIDTPLDIEVLFEDMPVAFDSVATAYPCHGAIHKLKMRRKPSDYPRNKEIFLVWTGEPAENLGVVMTPALAGSRLLTTDWISWEMNCADTVADGIFSLHLKVVNAEETTDVLSLSLGHNLVAAKRWQTGPHSHQPGSTFYFKYIQATSVHTKKLTPGVKVLINGASSGMVTNIAGEAVTTQTGSTKDLSIKNRYDGSIV
ncbi:hypothetical protein GIW70_07675 [Pseudomonas syringae]|nr:hypothetical protein [Pseudomonas syringae]